MTNRCNAHFTWYVMPLFASESSSSSSSSSASFTLQQRQQWRNRFSGILSSQSILTLQLPEVFSSSSTWSFAPLLCRIATLPPRPGLSQRQCPSLPPLCRNPAYTNVPSLAICFNPQLWTVYSICKATLRHISTWSLLVWSCCDAHLDEKYSHSWDMWHVWVCVISIFNKSVLLLF